MIDDDSDNEVIIIIRENLWRGMSQLSVASFLCTLYFYLRHRLVSEGIVTLGVTLRHAVCVSAKPLVSHSDCTPH